MKISVEVPVTETDAIDCISKNGDIENKLTISVHDDRKEKIFLRVGEQPYCISVKTKDLLKAIFNLGISKKPSEYHHFFGP